MPAIDFTNLNDTAKVSLGEPIQFHCLFAGIPRPTIQWYKDNELLELDPNDIRLSFHENKTLLKIKWVKSDDEGTFKCEASSRLGTTSLETKLHITSEFSISNCLR